MIEVIHYQNKAHESAFETFISDTLGEVRKLLPGLPKKMIRLNYE